LILKSFAKYIKRANYVLDKLSMLHQYNSEAGELASDKTGKENVMGTNEKISPDDPGVEAIVDDIIDLEEYAKLGKQPPLAKGYRIKVNGKHYVVHDPKLTGKEVLTLAGLLPVENYTLRVKKAGHKPEKVSLDEIVDLRCRGVEKFKALPRDQTKG
jgi:Multiubiquitin